MFKWYWLTFANSVFNLMKFHIIKLNYVAGKMFLGPLHYENVVIGKAKLEFISWENT